MARTGRPRKNLEKMSSVRVRDSQRALLEVIREVEGGSNHEVLTRIIKFYLNRHADLRKRVANKLLEAKQ